MSDDIRWSLDQDPEPDPALRRMLEAVGEVPEKDVNWEGLQGRVMERAGQRIRRRADPGEWYDIAARWIPAAAAAVLAALLLSGALVASTPAGETDTEAPEEVAVAQMVAAYPDEAVLASLIGIAGAEELSTWSDE